MEVMMDADKATAPLSLTAVGPTCRRARAANRRRTKPTTPARQATVATPRRDPDVRRLRHPIRSPSPTPLAWLP